ncbi:hypothetical protein NDU88_004905 [Pleurodeles waltl]|uniref:Uncharacterized protein n=1 Tax=Pleurodeles waltl TaxID=8319 RepID=A0AAV7L1K7_PLEWA|nr:hypothetical protein NDU88_004905 [Pleurodeles waltl]
MLAQMRSEALKRGKEWLRKKMEDAAPEGGPSLTMDQHASTGGANSDLQADREQMPKPNKRQKSMGKPAKKPTKRTRAPERETALPLDPETPENSSSRKAMDGEHINAIIKECLKSITPLLLKSCSAGASPDYTGKGKSQEHHSKGVGSRAHAQGTDRASPLDPTPAWGMPNRETEPFKSVGLPPEAYTRPSLGRPAMTTRAAGLANAIPLTVKERVWQKEFIDIFSLLEIQLEGLDLTICNKKDEDRRERKRARKERNFENCLDAFRIMVCVIVEISRAAQRIFGYMNLRYMRPTANSQGMHG